MALQTKEFSGIASNEYHQFTLTVIEDKIDKTNNQSTISWKFEISTAPGVKTRRRWKNKIKEPVRYTITINGKSYSGVIWEYYPDSSDATGVVLITSDSGLKVDHSATNGTKSITCQFKITSDDTANSNTTLPGTANVKGTMKLTTIPRQSKITSVSNITLGKACSVTWKPNSKTHKYKIKFTLGTWSYTTGFIEPKTTNSYTYKGYTIRGDVEQNSTTIYKLLPSSTSGTMKATLTTYNSSGTAIGSTSSKNFTVTIPSSVKPTVGKITFDPHNVNTSSGSSNKLVKGRNTLRIYVGQNRIEADNGQKGTPSKPGEGSTLVSCKISGPFISETNTSTPANALFTKDSIDTSGKLAYTVTVKDSRGRTASKKATVTCYDYYSPYFSISSFTRKGTSLKLKYKVSYADINGADSGTVKIYAKVDGATEYTCKKTITGVASGNTYTETVSLGDATKSYTVYATVKDAIGVTTETIKQVVYSTTKVMNVSKNGKSVAIGKDAATDECFDSRWQIKTDKPAQTMKNLTYKGRDTINTEALDTVANWVSQGNLATMYYTGTETVNNKPTTSGFVLNITGGPNATQTYNLWLSQSSGTMFHRNSSTTTNGVWDGSWVKILDANNVSDSISGIAVMKPTSLYKSSDGNNGTVTLSASAADFSYLEIFYVDNNGNGMRSTRILSPNSKNIFLDLTQTSSNADTTYIVRTYYSISGKTITPNVTNSGRVKIDGADVTSAAGTNYIYITRVFGYN